MVRKSGLSPFSEGAANSYTESAEQHGHAPTPDHSVSRFSIFIVRAEGDRLPELQADAKGVCAECHGEVLLLRAAKPSNGGS